MYNIKNLFWVKKIIILIIILLSSINYTYSNYTLSDNDNVRVDKAITLINKYIDKKGEIYRDKLILKIDRILERDNISEKITAIFTKLKKWIEIVNNTDDKIQEEKLMYNEEEVRFYWLSLLNKARLEEKLWLYKYDNSLDYTAKLWSEQALKRWYIDHKVNSWDSYYDYSKKANWMKNEWVLCKNIYRVTFSESIAWWEFYCKTDDCTQEVKNTMDKNYNFFMSEKWKDYSPHYDAIINKYFTTMGLWLTIKNNWNNKYTLFLTNHYCTKNIN